MNAGLEPDIGNIQVKRLLSLIEFAQHAALFRASPVSDITKHGIFHQLEHATAELPGVRVNLGTEEGEGDLWMVVERLQEIHPPRPKSALLGLWMDLSNDPTKPPNLHAQVLAQQLIMVGAVSLMDKSPGNDPKAPMSFEHFPQREAVEAQFKEYLERQWQPWSEDERPRRRSLSLYNRLYTVKQRLEGDISDVQLELAWGIGMVVWEKDGKKISYPVMSRLVELTLNERTLAIEVRPRELDARLELDILAASGAPGLEKLEEVARDFFTNATTTFSPFDRATFEPLLNAAATCLNNGGVYWPSQVGPEDRTLPKPDTELRVTDTWVLFARPRSANLFIQDLERFRSLLIDAQGPVRLAPALQTLVTDPSEEVADLTLTNFRGVSMVRGSDEGSVKELFFPLPFNDEQVRIVQMLDSTDGVVVQGPPGTGKTHTIANVICHFLALGKRVLVTSMREPALGVLRAMLPEEVRPLCISLFASEIEGVRQFEHAIFKIADEVQRIDRLALNRQILLLEEGIEALHAQLSRVDRQIVDWAIKNLRPIALEDEVVEPQVAAEQAAVKLSESLWLEDEIAPEPRFAPLFNDQDIDRLREARKGMGEYIDHLGCTLPLLDDFTDTKTLVRVHRDLAKAASLQSQIDQGDIPDLPDATKSTLERAQNLAQRIQGLRQLRGSIAAAGYSWGDGILQLLRKRVKNSHLEILDRLGKEVKIVEAERTQYLSRPVTISADADADPDVMQALEKLGQGKSAFGMGAMFGKGGAKKVIDQVRVLNGPCKSDDDWIHVLNYVRVQKRMRELVTRWNVLSRDMGLPSLTANPDDALVAASYINHFRKLKDQADQEYQISNEAKELLARWDGLAKLAIDDTLLEQAESFLNHHVTQNKLVENFTMRGQFEQVLNECSGRITDKFRDFFAHKLGDPAISVAEMQDLWQALMDELRRLHDMKDHAQAIASVTTLIGESGAPIWAGKLKSQATQVDGDLLLPTDWRSRWRLRRLATHIFRIDGRKELRQLTDRRRESEMDLAKAYREITSKRTWLKLAENATPAVRGALMAYMNAISKIGKGMGIRATRYRQDARQAAAHAYPAIPCWIMPHYRISESMPAQFGCFDLVIIDEASQSDLAALPALLRAQKILVVGDDKQVSPEGIGMEEEKIRTLIGNFLGNQVEAFRAQMTPERSMYDLFRVVYANSAVMLKEHFRCVAPIIEYSKREFYHHELRPLRMPRSSERLDPPLIDIFVQDGARQGELNIPEARVIVDEIRTLTEDPAMAHRSIGVVSLMGDHQSLKIWEMIEDELGLDAIRHFQIACGDARTFQGKERDIIFLSMVVSAGNATALSRDIFAQRFNVAASRARDRMYLIRSIGSEDLAEADKLRRGLIAHFASPFQREETRYDNLRLRCETTFERALYDALVGRGYRVVPQMAVGNYAIDLVVEGHNDNRMAIECDGDRHSGPESWDDDMRQQRVLERAGWRFWRCFAAAYIMHPNEVIEELVVALRNAGIEAIGADTMPDVKHVEHRSVIAVPSQPAALFGKTDSLLGRIAAG